MDMSPVDPLERVRGLAAARQLFLDYPEDHHLKTDTNDTASRKLLEEAIATAISTDNPMPSIAEAASMTIAEISTIASDAA